MDIIEHHIQRDIIARLMHANTTRFSQLKPEGMESNIFMYHLKQLIKVGYVEKQQAGYALAPTGLGYVDNLSLTNHKPRLQPKIVAMFILTNMRGEVLMSKRLNQPFLGHYTFPCGKQHIGETINEHALREKQEKLGFEIEVRYRGQFESLIEMHNTPIFHTLNHIFSAQLQEDKTIVSPDDRFELEWVGAQKLSLLPLVPAVEQIFNICERVKTDTTFIESVRTSL